MSNRPHPTTLKFSRIERGAFQYPDCDIHTVLATEDEPNDAQKAFEIRWTGNRMSLVSVKRPQELATVEYNSVWKVKIHKWHHENRVAGWITKQVYDLISLLPEFTYLITSIQDRRMDDVS
jgi:hypothetical protein